MTRKEMLDLVKQYAPILWLHEREMFLPVDAQRMVDLCDLYRKGEKLPKNQQPKTLDDLGALERSHECYLKLPDLDMRDFKVPHEYRRGIGMSGPAAVMQLARELYGRDLAGDGVPSRGPDRPKYYARVSEVQVRRRQQDAFTESFKHRDPGIFGEYLLVEYFFYFVYNDSWNQHQGDWDCMIELYIKDDRTYMINHLHKVRWVSRWPEHSPDLPSWLDHWERLRGKELGDAYEMGGHPYVFLTQGAHAGYPTPGFTLHGLDVPGIISRDDFLTNTDERQIGRICILPPRVDEELIRTNLRVNEVPTNKLSFGRWAEPELVEDQPWLDYEGRWGEESPYMGWDGPQRPPISKRPDRNGLRATILSGYRSGSVLWSWHGI